MGRAWAELTLRIQMPDVGGVPPDDNKDFVTIKGHYTGYPAGGVKQADQDFEIMIERFPYVDEKPLHHSVRKIVSRLIAYYLSRDL